MEYEFDPAKAQANLIKHGVSFDTATEFDWTTALIEQDTREEYGEDRFNALGLIGDRVHMMTFTIRSTNVRIIGLRKANSREIKRHERQ